MKTCSGCKKEKYAWEFPPFREGKSGLNPKCRECLNANAARWRTRNKKRSDATMQAWMQKNHSRIIGYGKNNRLRKFNLSKEELDEGVAAQGGLCAICRKTPSGGPGNLTKFVVDHDRSCCDSGASCGLCIRGLLCIQCNTALGMFSDSVASLYNAIAYLMTFDMTKSQPKELGWMGDDCCAYETQAMGYDPARLVSERIAGFEDGFPMEFPVGRKVP